MMTAIQAKQIADFYPEMERAQRGQKISYICDIALGIIALVGIAAAIGSAIAFSAVPLSLTLGLTLLISSIALSALSLGIPALLNKTAKFEKKTFEIAVQVLKFGGTTRLTKEKLAFFEKFKRHGLPARLNIKISLATPVEKIREWAAQNFSNHENALNSLPQGNLRCKKLNQVLNSIFNNQPVDQSLFDADPNTWDFPELSRLYASGYVPESGNKDMGDAISVNFGMRSTDKDNLSAHNFFEKAYTRSIYEHNSSFRK